MKRDIYVVVGIVALVAAAVIGATFLYKKNVAPQVQAPRADRALLLGDGDSPSIGPIMAKVQVIEFLDPECESCRAMHPIVKSILKDYEGRIRYTLRYMPLHGNSVYASTMLEAAREQSRYWEALDALFERQDEWGAHHNPRPDLIPVILKAVGLDINKLKAFADKPETKARVQNDKEDGVKLGVNGTPTFFVNERQLQELGEGPLRALIDEELAAAN